MATFADTTGSFSPRRRVDRDVAYRPDVPIKKMLQGWFRKQKAHVLGQIGKSITAKVRGTSPFESDKWTDLDHFTADMAADAQPMLGIYYDQGIGDLIARLGLDPDDLIKVANPRVRDAIKRASFKFCRDTNRATSLGLKVALTKLRQELTSGMLDGPNTIADLTKRVSAIFDQAEDYRADRIARTEAARATHAGGDLAAKDSGVVSGYKWLLSADACPLCQEIADKNPDGVALGSNFATLDGGGPYADVPYPPAHPNCTCTVVEILTAPRDTDEE